MAGRQKSLWIFAMKVNLLMTKKWLLFHLSIELNLSVTLGEFLCSKHNTAYTVGTPISVARTRM